MPESMTMRCAGHDAVVTAGAEAKAASFEARDAVNRLLGEFDSLLRGPGNPVLVDNRLTNLERCSAEQAKDMKAISENVAQTAVVLKQLIESRAERRENDKLRFSLGTTLLVAILALSGPLVELYKFLSGN